jgi:alkanesulfonate monooxygenase SsuD/methylene tetrahydromethanopterin reductase-like flavin-dependent oxidoreductase (luciferase family)
MRLGVAIFLTDRTVAPARLARATEERGLASLFVPEHTHVPVDHSPHPAGGELPDEYRRTLDPFVALARPRR